MGGGGGSRGLDGLFDRGGDFLAVERRLAELFDDVEVALAETGANFFFSNQVERELFFSAPCCEVERAPAAID